MPIAQVATLNKMEINSSKGKLNRYFTKDTLVQLAKSAVGKPIKLGFHGQQVSTVDEAWVENDSSVIIRCNCQYMGYKYIVPGFKTTSSKGEHFQTVRCLDFALVNNPTDKSLMEIQYDEKDSEG